MRHLSEWLGARGLTAGDLDTDVIGAFVVDRRAVHVGLRSERALWPLLAYLRGLGVVPACGEGDVDADGEGGRAVRSASLG